MIVKNIHHRFFRLYFILHKFAKQRTVCSKKKNLLNTDDYGEQEKKSLALVQEFQ